MSKLFSKIMLICVFVLMSCKEPEPAFRILISYDGEYEFSSYTRLKLSLTQISYTDGPSNFLGILDFYLKRLPSQILVDEPSPAIDPYVSVVATVDSSKEAEMKFDVLDEGTAFDRSVIHLRAREDLGHFYRKDSQGIYYGSQRLEGCDPASFAFIDTVQGSFVKDASHVYQGSQLIVDADPASFQTLNLFYQKDARRVYSYGASVEGADINTFQIYPDNSYARDATAVYYRDRKILGADTDSFNPLGSSEYAKDKGVAYFSGERIPDSDVQTFSVISYSGYSTDSKAVFWRTKRLERANPSNFRVFAKDTANGDVYPAYATDGARVYFQSDLIPGADAATFEILPVQQGGGSLDYYRARDKNRTYSGSIPIPQG